MATSSNDGWPEAFGFSIAGGDPVVISSVEDGGSAQQAGLQQGDMLAEVDGEDVRHWSVREVVERVRHSVKVPPGLLVVSRVRTFDIPRSKTCVGFGITLRGDSPVYIRSVDFDSPARAAGVRSGDLVLRVNDHDVRYSSKMEALELLKETGGVLQLVVVAGGIHSVTGSNEQQLLESTDEPEGHQQRKANIFHDKVHYYLHSDETKRSYLFTLLRLYLKNQDIDSLSQSLNILLETYIERRLLGDIRSFINPHHLVRFDALVSYKNRQQQLGMRTRSTSSPRLLPRGTGGAIDNSRQQSAPSVPVEGQRHVTINRLSGEFGFSLSGNAPVFIRSVDGMSPAALAGVEPGEYIIEINGLDVRLSTHSQVVRLLKGSGGRPTLLLSSAPPSLPPAPPPAPVSHGSPALHRATTQPLHVTAGNRGNGSNHGSPIANSAMRRDSRILKDKMEKMLPQQDKKEVYHQLNHYATSKDMPGLVSALTRVLSDPSHHALYHHICQLLPEEERNEFDHLAATTISRNSTDASRLREDAAGERVTASTAAARNSDRRTLPSSTAHLSTAEEQRPLKETATHRLSGGDRGREKNGAVHVKKSKSDERGKPKQRRTSKTDQVLPPSAGAPPPPPPPPGVPLPPPPPPLLSPITGAGTPGQPAMKRVNWEKLHGLEGTIWSEMSGLQESLEYSKLETQFTAAGASKLKQAKSKDETPSVLDKRKAYNISILLGHLKLPHNTVKLSLLACDTSRLTEQHLQQLETFAPDSKECKEYTRYYSNITALSLPDRFSCEMSTIPCYKQRLRALLFKQRFQEKVDEISSDLTAIMEASTQVHSSRNFKKILELILAVGNYMNVKSRQVGSAEGFRIKYLTQLKDVRAADNKSSLLHFIAATAHRKLPQAMDFIEELSIVKKASRVSGKTLEVEITELRRGLKEAKEVLQQISEIQDPHPNERFPQIMRPFITSAQGLLASLVTHYSTMKKDFQRALQLFGEDPIHTQIDDFFSIIATFLVDFENAVKENKRAIEEEQRRENQMKRDKERRGKTTPQSRHKPPLSAAQDNVVDLREELAQKAALRGEKKRGQPNNIEQEQQQDEAVDGLEFDHETSF